MNIIVASKRSGAQGEYVGRPSALGNPFEIGRDGDRSTVIAKYRTWLWERMRTSTPQRRELERLAQIAREGNLTLVCWCSPLACHGDVIAAAIRWLTAE